MKANADGNIGFLAGAVVNGIHNEIQKIPGIFSLIIGSTVILTIPILITDSGIVTTLLSGIRFIHTIGSVFHLQLFGFGVTFQTLTNMGMDVMNILPPTDRNINGLSQATQIFPIWELIIIELPMAALVIDVFYLIP